MSQDPSFAFGTLWSNIVLYYEYDTQRMVSSHDLDKRQQNAHVAERTKSILPAGHLGLAAEQVSFLFPPPPWIAKIKLLPSRVISAALVFPSPHPATADATTVRARRAAMLSHCCLGKIRARNRGEKLARRAGSRAHVKQLRAPCKHIRMRVCQRAARASAIFRSYSYNSHDPCQSRWDSLQGHAHT